MLKYTGDKYEGYGLVVDLNDLDNYLAGLEQKDIIEFDVIPRLSYDVKKDFPNYRAKIKEWLEEASEIETNDIIKLFDRLKEVSDKPLNFEDFFDDDNLYEKWAELSGTTDLFKYDLLAMRIARRDNISKAHALEFKNILENYDDEDAEALAKVIEYYINFGDLLMHSDYYRDYPLVRAVVALLTDKSYGPSRVDIMDCLAHFDQTVDDYQIDDLSLFERISRWVKYVDFNKKTVDKMPSGLLKVAKESDTKLTKVIFSACEDYYASQTQDQWKEHMLKKDNTYRIWKEYHPKKYQANFDALKAVLKDYASNTTTNQPNKTIVNEWLIICLELKHSVKGLFNDISSILKRGLINKAKLLYFGKFVLEYADAEKQTDFVIKLIPTEIIDADVIGFIYEHIERLKVCEIPDEFKEKVKHLAETSMKDDERIVAVCQGMGVILSQPEEEHES